MYAENAHVQFKLWRVSVPNCAPSNGMCVLPTTFNFRELWHETLTGGIKRNINNSWNKKRKGDFKRTFKQIESIRSVSGRNGACLWALRFASGTHVLPVGLNFAGGTQILPVGLKFCRWDSIFCRRDWTFFLEAGLKVEGECVAASFVAWFC